MAAFTAAAGSLVPMAAAMQADRAPVFPLAAALRSFLASKGSPEAAGGGLGVCVCNVCVQCVCQWCRVIFRGGNDVVEWL